MISMNRRDAQANDLVLRMKEYFRGDRKYLNQFSDQFLTEKGDAIAAEAEPLMSEKELLEIAYRAIDAGY